MSRFTKITFILAILSVILGIVSFSIPFFYAAIIFIIPFTIYLAKTTLKNYCSIFTTPLKFLHELLTNTLSISPNTRYKEGLIYKTAYVNKTQFIIFGIFGNIIYYLLLVSLITLVFGFRPYGDGYIYKQTSYTVGDEVVVKINDEKYIAIVKDYKTSDDKDICVTVEYDGKTLDVGNTVFDDAYINGVVKGTYETEGNGFIHFIKSGWHWFLYMIQFVYKIFYLIIMDFKK